MSTRARKLLPRVGPGSTIGVYSPSEPLSEERRARLTRGLNVLGQLGFRTHVPKSAFASRYYMAGSVRERLDSLNGLLRDNSVAAVMSSYGGKSANQLLPGFDYDGFADNPKVVSGFSDPAVLLNGIYARTGYPTLYGPDVVGKLDDATPEDLELFLALLSGEEGICYHPRPQMSPRVISEGTAEGVLVGGNLSSFVLGVLNTRYEPPLDGAIFFWETASPKPRELHQTLTYLANTGLLEKLTGMLVGYLGGVVDSRPWANRDPLDLIAEVVEEYDFPCLYLPIFGHGDCPKAPLPVGIHARLDTGEASLTLLEPLCGD